MNIRLIIFDFDGTLADTRRLIVDCKQETMRRLGLEVKDDDICASTIGLSAFDGFRQTYPEQPEEMISKCVSIYRELFEERKTITPPGIFPNVTETLREIHKRNVPCTIASSRNTRSLTGFLVSTGLEGYFNYVLGGDDTERRKPDPDPVLKTIRDFGIPAENTLVVGDMPFDIIMGKSAGTYACGVTFGNSDRESLKKAGADYVIDDISDILELI